jgi:LPXTG-site transpeptidase (sortase) family protein
MHVAAEESAALDPAAAMVGEPATRERQIELRREARQQQLRLPRQGLLYDIRFLVALFVVAVAIVAIGLWELLSQQGPALPSPGGGAFLPGNGVSLPGGPLLPVFVAAVAAFVLVRRIRHHSAVTDKLGQPGRGWRQLYDTRLVASILAVVLAGYGFAQLAPPGATPDIREIPGEVSNAIQAAAAQPETGFPRIKISAVSIDLLLVKGDGKTPPVKYEAFTYPGADHLLTGDESGGSNTYVYAHARNGMFWRLHDLHIGNIVDVDYGGAKILHYRVSEIHPSVNWKDLNWLQPTTDDRLTLQTCNGWKDDDPRFVVVARRVPDKTALAG